MGRFLLVTVSAVLVFMSFGQIPEGIKYDKIEFSYDSSSCILTKGKKQAVYNYRHENIAVPPTKNKLINFPGSNVYAEIPVKPGNIIIHFLNAQKVVSFYCTPQQGKIKISNPLENLIVEADGRYYNLATDEYTVSVPPGTTDWGLHEIKKIGDGIYLINGYRNELKWMVQEELRSKEGINGSGIYSTAENKWLIEPSYKYIDQLNGYFFCAKEYQVERIIDGDRIIQEEGKQYMYDIFRLTDNGTFEKIADEVSELSNELLSKILDFDSVITSGFENIYQSLKEDKSGLFLFDLVLSDEQPMPGIQYSSLLNPEFEYIHMDNTQHIFFTLNKSSANAVSLYWINSSNQPIQIISHPKMVGYFIDDYYYQKTIVTPDTMIAADDYRDSIIFNIVDYTVPVPDFGSGLKILNDSLLLVYKSNSAVLNGIESILYPGEDSVDEYSHTVYEISTPGSAHTGIYNLRTKSWLIQPEYFNVIFNNANFVSSYPSNTFYFSLDNFYYTSFNSKGEIQFQGKSMEEIKSAPTLFKKVIPFENCVEIQNGTGGLSAHSRLTSKPEFSYIFSNDSMGIYYPDIYFENQFENNYFDFVHYNSELKSSFQVVGDSVFFKSPEFQFTASLKEKLVYLPTGFISEREKQIHSLIKISGTDTTFLSEINEHRFIYYLSFEMVGDSVIVINDWTDKGGTTCIECYNESGYYNLEQSFQTENSSIWKKTKQGWRKISPYYTTIEPVSNGYFIASSGEFYESFMSQENNWKQEITELEKRYFLLNSDLKAIPYMDYFDFAYIEDLGFGFKVKLNEGDKYFFMTYDLEALTNAEWDHFELENGKLKAMIYTVYQLDEIGEIVLDEFGNPVELVTQTTKYFKLPLNYKY